MGSCVQEILCAFSEAYGDYLSPVCEQPNLITDLLKIADNNIPEEYFLDDCPNQYTLIEAEKMLKVSNINDRCEEMAINLC